MSLELFQKGTFMFYDEDKNEGYLSDIDDNDLAKFSYSDDNTPFELKLYVNESIYDLRGIKEAKMCQDMKKEILLYFHILQEQLDNENPSIDDEQYDDPNYNKQF